MQPERGPLGRCDEFEPPDSHTRPSTTTVRKLEPFDPAACNSRKVVGDTAATWQTSGCSDKSRASLAQSVERFHGKEKVDSSILSGGSRRAHARSVSGRTAPHGDVAQLVRVLDS